MQLQTQEYRILNHRVASGKYAAWILCIVHEWQWLAETVSSEQWFDSSLGSANSAYCALLVHSLHWSNSNEMMSLFRYTRAEWVVDIIFFVEFIEYCSE